jgi:cell division protein FtsZ
MLVNVSGGEDIALMEYEEVMNYITKNADPDAHIIIGQTVNASLGDKMQVTVIATGFKNNTIKMQSKEQEQAQETAKAGKGDYIGYGEFMSITERTKGAPEYLSQRGYRDDDIEVPTLLRDRKYNMERDSEKFGSAVKDG